MDVIDNKIKKTLIHVIALHFSSFLASMNFMHLHSILTYQVNRRVVGISPEYL